MEKLQQLLVEMYFHNGEIMVLDVFIYVSYVFIIMYPWIFSPL